MKVKLLIGSGVSLKAGMPNCNDIGFTLRNGNTFGIDRANNKFANHYVERYNDYKYVLKPGIWEEINNPSFNSLEFEGILMNAGLINEGISLAIRLEKLNKIAIQQTIILLRNNHVKL